MIPQIIMIILIAISLARSVHMHGKPKEGNHDFRDDIIAIAIGQGMLIWGGFYGVFL